MKLLFFCGAGYGTPGLMDIKHMLLVPQALYVFLSCYIAHENDVFCFALFFAFALRRLEIEFRASFMLRTIDLHSPVLSSFEREGTKSRDFEMSSPRPSAGKFELRLSGSRVVIITPVLLLSSFVCGHITAPFPNSVCVD